MTGYVCDRCPLAFEIGYYGYWDLCGGCVTYICRNCGTMHKIEHLQREQDMFYTLGEPIREMVEVAFESLDGETHTTPRLPVFEDSWRLVSPLPTAKKFLQGMFVLPDRAQSVELGSLACGHCGRAGGLVSQEWPLSQDGNWPMFGDNCPVCAGPLQSVYADTIN